MLLSPATSRGAQEDPCGAASAQPGRPKRTASSARQRAAGQAQISVFLDDADVSIGGQACPCAFVLREPVVWCATSAQAGESERPQ